MIGRHGMTGDRGMDPVNESLRVLGNRYEVGDLLGRGGMAEVHIGRDTRLGRVVAIKLLRNDLARDPTFQARFRREAQSAAGLNHPAIVSVYDTGEETVAESGGGFLSLPYIVMEYVEGLTLRDMMRDRQPLDLALALEVTSGVLAALDYSHRAGIVHRDIKPANVMLTPQGDVKVMDFGIARALADVSATMTQTQAVIGTAQYLSPEQARGETVDARSDLYSAGCLLFELVTARPPFVADSPVAVAYQHVREQPSPPSFYNPSLPPDVDRVVLHSLAKDRETRYQTALQFKSDVDAVRAGHGLLAAAPIGSATGAVTEYLQPSAAGTRAMTPMVTSTQLQAPATGYPPEPMVPGLAVNEVEYDDYPPRRGDRQDSGDAGRRVGYAALILAVIALFGGVVWGVSNYIGAKNTPAAATTVQVPSLLGMTQREAQAAVKAVKDGRLTLAVGPSVPDETVPVDHIVSQTPSADTPVGVGAIITIVLSTGPTSITVPDVTGKSQDDARKILTDAGLTPGNADYVDSYTVDKGRVVSTDPKADSPAGKLKSVALMLSNGGVTLGDEKGKTESVARQDLAKRGIPDGKIKTKTEPSTDPAVATGQVTRTDPSSGSFVKKDGSVTLYLANTPSPSASPSDSAAPSASALPAPTGLTVSPGPDNRSAALTWSTVNGAAQYKIYRDGREIGQVGQASDPNNPYVDRNLRKNNTYTYTITAVAQDGTESAPSGSQQITIN